MDSGSHVLGTVFSLTVSGQAEADMMNKDSTIAHRHYTTSIMIRIIRLFSTKL